MKNGKPQATAPSKSAGAQPKIKAKTKYIRLDGKNVIITGQLAAEVRHYIEKQSSNVPPIENLEGVLGAITGMQLEKQQRVEIELPKPLARWANDTAYHRSEELSDLVRQLLEYERYREERFCVRVKDAKGGAR